MPTYVLARSLADIISKWAYAILMIESEDTLNPLHWAAGYREEKPVSMREVRSLAEVERTYIEMVLMICRGNVPKAAALLQISPSTLYRKQSRWHEQGR